MNCLPVKRVKLDPHLDVSADRAAHVRRREMIGIRQTGASGGETSIGFAVPAWNLCREREFKSLVW